MGPNRRVLVTGGCGFIGVNTIRVLEREGYAVSVLDNLSTGAAQDIGDTAAVLYRGDIRNMSDVVNAMDDVSMVVHLAAHTRVVESIQNPQENFEVNAQGTLNVLKAAKERSIERVVMASTGGAIIGDVTPPVHEDMIPRPVSVYGASKLAAEAYGSAYNGSFGLKFVSLRFANVYGPYSYHKGSVVAQFFKDYFDGHPWTVYGDGTQTRDFVFVEDIALAIVRALQYEDVSFEVFNLGTGKETSINHLMRMLEDVLPEPPLAPIYRPLRQGEVLRNYTSIEKARAVLGYEPHYELKKGLQVTADWFRLNYGA